MAIIQHKEHCSKCDGFGKIGEKDCPDCNGNGNLRYTKVQGEPTKSRLDKKN